MTRDFVMDLCSALGIPCKEEVLKLDDVLDADEDDGTSPRPSFVRLLGLDETRRRAAAARDEALSVIADLPRPGQLAALARFIVDRDH